MFRRLLIVSCLVSHLLLVVGLTSSFAGKLPLSHEQVVYANIVLLSIASLAAVCRRRLTVRRNDWILLSIIVLYGLSVLVPTASAHSMSSMCTIELWLTPLTIFCFVWAVPKTLTRRDLEVVFLGIVSLFTVHGLLTAYMVATQTHCLFGQELFCTTGRPQLYWGKRGALVTGLFAHPNALGSCLILLPALAFSLAARLQRTWQRAFMVSSGSLLVLNLLVLMSRSCTLTTMAALAVAGVSSKLVKPWVRYVAVGAMLLAAFCACYAIFDWRTDNSTCLRSFIWMGFVDAVLENPFGSGWNSVVVFNQNPHSCLLANLVYFGVMGFVLLLALFIMLLTRAAYLYRREPTSLVLVLSLASMLLIHQSVEYVVSYPLLFSNSIFWLLLGYLQLPTETLDKTGLGLVSRPIVRSCVTSDRT